MRFIKLSGSEKYNLNTSMQPNLSELSKKVVEETMHEMESIILNAMAAGISSDRIVIREPTYNVCEDHGAVGSFSIGFIPEIA